MDFTIRQLNENDYDDIIVGWWKEWGWSPVPKDMLPDNGTGGVIIYDGDIPICSGYIYTTNSKHGWAEWVLSNKKYEDKEKRKAAIKLLIETLTNMLKEKGCKYCCALLHHEGLIKTYEDLGFIKGTVYSCEMIKIL
jgi:hypothetical protein